MSKRPTLQGLVESGQFSKAREQAHRLEKRRSLDQEEHSWLMGALSFTGEEELLNQRLKGLKKNPSLIRDRGFFFCILLYTRLGEYATAHKFLDQLKKRKTFYAYQARGFFSFYEGRFQKAYEQAQLAQQQSTTQYELYLALDLKGHAMAQTGQTIQGIALLEQAREHLSSRGLARQAEATRVSILSIKAEYGIELKKTLSEMDTYIETPTTEDFYSLSLILIDRARVCLLQGQFLRAEELSRLAALTLYRSQNKRQTILLNLLLARLAALKEDYLRAFTLVETNLKLCDPRVDRALISKCLGILIDLQEDLKDHPWAQSLNVFAQGRDEQIDQLKRLVTETNRYIAYRHERRRGRADPSFPLSGKELDPLGDLLDRVAELSVHPNEAQERLVLQECIDLELLGLIKRLPSFKKAKKIIALNWPAQNILSINEAEVHLHPEAPSPMIVRLLQRLEKAPQSKEQLITELYGYDYDPLIHDPLIYALIARLRKSLGPHASLLTLQEEGYALHSDVRILDRHQAPLKHKVTELPEQLLDRRLNGRQNDLIDLLSLGKIKEISPSEYRTTFDVSRITATRDLKELCDLGYLITLGRARGIKYRLSS